MNSTRRIRRGFATVAAGALVFALLPAGAALAGIDEACAQADDADFPDTTGALAQEIECLAGFGVVIGRESGNFDPIADITRGEAALIQARLIETATGETLDDPDDDVFDDVDETNPTVGTAVAKLFAAGVVQGFGDGTFRPGEPISRDEGAALIARTIEFITGDDLPDGTETFADVPDSNVFNDLLGDLQQLGIAKGTGTNADGEDLFSPNDDIRRSEYAAFATRGLGYLDDVGDFFPTRSFDGVAALSTAEDELFYLTEGADAQDNFNLGGATTFTVDGSDATQAEASNALANGFGFGDTVAFDGDQLDITNVTDVRTYNVTDVQTDDDDLSLDGDTFDLTNDAGGLIADDFAADAQVPSTTENAYFVNGVEVTRAGYNAALNQVEDNQDDDDDTNDDATFTGDTELGVTNHRLTVDSIDETLLDTP